MSLRFCWIIPPKTAPKKKKTHGLTSQSTIGFRTHRLKKKVEGGWPNMLRTRREGQQFLSVDSKVEQQHYNEKKRGEKRRNRSRREQ